MNSIHDEIIVNEDQLCQKHEGEKSIFMLFLLIKAWPLLSCFCSMPDIEFFPSFFSRDVPLSDVDRSQTKNAVFCPQKLNQLSSNKGRSATRCGRDKTYSG